MLLPLLDKSVVVPYKRNKDLRDNFKLALSL